MKKIIIGLDLGIFIILIAVQIIYVINALNNHYGLEVSYAPSICMIILGVLQILVPFIYSVYKRV